MTDATQPLSRPAVYTIRPGVAFVDALAVELLARAGGEPLALADMRILLPTRRACRVMADAFLRHGGGRPLLLPRISPLGDVDEDELGLDIAHEDEVGDDPALPPAIAPLRRQLLLMRLILADPMRDASPEQAARLAAELGRLLDQAIIEGVDLSALGDLVPEQYAGHWQTTLRFLAILTEHWPRILESEGCIDAADRRNRLLQAEAQGWLARPPRGPVIAAGSTGSIPATAALLTVVSRLPQGMVVLPGLDRDADDETWAALEPTHPQHAMARLLERIGIDRRDVREWPSPPRPETPPARAMLVNRALRPAAATALHGPPIAADALADVTRIDAPGPAEEARTIALIMRETLETEGRTAALVTPDRGLARRVAGELQRWDVAVDDSAGAPLASTPPFVFLRLIARMVAEDFAPVPLLAALKHPLAAGGAALGRLRRRVRRLERACLRGVRPAPGLVGLRAALAERAPDARQPELAALLDEIEALTAPLRAAAAGEWRVHRLVAAHAETAEALAASDDTPGGARLWSGEAGEAAAAFLAELAEQSQDIAVAGFTQYADLIEALAAGRVVRPRYGRHPRLFIWGPLEARLQHADVTILGGLNEETWPPRVPAGPWMSRPMMRACGLPLPERRIGLSAHDFVQAFCAPRVYLTRARRSEGTPTVACRWLLRLEAALAADPAAPGVDDGAAWLAWAHALDEPAVPAAPIAPPEPRPPVAVRPRRLSVTEIERWMRDPYAIYARHVLGLRALEPLDKELGPAEFGTFVHAAIHRFLGEGDPAAADAPDRLREAGRRILGNDLRRPEIAAFWWPRFERLADWLVEQERDRAGEIAAIASEVPGCLELDVAGGAFALTARADRIETRRDGRLVLVDYKTGAPPKPKQVAAGFSPQLPLEGAMAEQGAFEGVAAGAIEALEYWRLSGGRNPAELVAAGQDRRAPNSDPHTLVEDALAGLCNLITRFDLPDTPYRARPRPAYAPPFSDYEHLERVREWGAVGEETGS